MLIDLYVSGNKESAFDAGERAGLSGLALDRFLYAAYEVKLTYSVNEATGTATLVRVDDKTLEPNIKVS